MHGEVMRAEKIGDLKELVCDKINNDFTGTFSKKTWKNDNGKHDLPVQIFLASRDLQYDFPKIGSLRSPVCNFLLTFVQV